MPQLQEALVGEGQLAATLAAGLESLSQQQTVTFDRYVRLVLPLDGFVFWVKASLLAPSALFGATPGAQRHGFNTAAFNAPLRAAGPPNRIVAKGSLHFSTVVTQTDDGVNSTNRVVFSSEDEVADLNRVSPTDIYIATFDHYPTLPASLLANPATGSSEAGAIGIGQSAIQGVVMSGVSGARAPDPIRFTFSRRNSFYQQAALYHYEGDAVYPDMSTQIVDSIIGFDTKSLVLSNSMPAWLTLDRYFPVYPAYMEPFNLEPPYATVTIDPNSTRALQAVPEVQANPSRLSSAIGSFVIGESQIQGDLTNPESTHWQLTRDVVRVTLVGVRNQAAMTWLDYALYFSGVFDDYAPLGLMNMPTVRDDRRGQVEFGTLAQKKTIEFEVSYHQTAIEYVARQLILRAIANFIVP